MSNWWVNQNQTYKFEVPGQFLWSPKTNKNGSKNHFYDNMELVKSGDLIFSFCDTKIKAVGVASDRARTADKPEFDGAGENWAKDGWLVPVEFTEVDSEVRPKEFIDELKPHLAEKYAPLQSNGNGNQGAYLVSISDSFARILLEKIGRPASFFSVGTVAEEKEDDEAEKAIEGRTDIGETEKRALIKARRGQGIFKTNVSLNEKNVGLPVLQTSAC